MIKNKIFYSGQTIDLATGETYTLKTDEVFINGYIYKKKDLEVATQNIYPTNLPENIKVAIKKRDGVMNLPANFVRFDEWEIDGTKQTNLSECVENLSDCIYFSDGGGNNQPIVNFKNTTNITTETIDGIYYQTIDLVGTGTVAEPQYPIGKYSIIEGVISGFTEDVNSDMAETDPTKKEFVQNKNRVLPVLTTRNFQPNDDDAILDIQGNCTLKLMDNLQSTFSVNIKVIDNFTCNIIADAGVVMKDNKGVIQTSITADQNSHRLIWRRTNGDFIVE